MNKSSGPRSIAMVCTDLEGLVSSGDGVAKANAAIAECISAAGHRISIYFVSRLANLVQDFHKWQLYYSDKNIDLNWLQEPPFIIEGLDPARVSYAAYLQLRNQNFDIIHFQGAQGLGYYTALAKSQGLDFDKSLICVDLHGPAYWGMYGNEEVVPGPDEMLKFYLERKSVELADVLISPSQYLVSWAESAGWKLPQRKFVEQFPISWNESLSYRGKTSNFKEIIFYGRLETRRGIVEFCDALDALPNNLLQHLGVSVTFLGGHGSPRWVHSAEYLSQRGHRWSHHWKVISDFPQDEEMKYIAGRDALVVIPYREDSMGYSVLECLRAGAPMIAADIQTFREIIDPRDHKSVLFKNDAAGLSAKINTALKEGVKRARFSAHPKATAKNWGSWHSKIEIHASQKANLSKQNFLVSVCVTHRNRPSLLKQCLDSLEQQTYFNIEVILVDDASDTPEAKTYLKSLEAQFRSKKWKILKQKKSIGPSEIRNRAAKLARGEYLLFMDDDNFAKPNEISTFMKAALTSNADILTCACDRFTGVKPPSGLPISRWPPLGSEFR